MSERPSNYKEVLRKARFRKDLSPVRWKSMLARINAVLDGEGEDEFKEWSPEDVNMLKEDLDK